MSVTDSLPLPSFHSLLLTSLVERIHPRCSSLTAKHILSPHLPLSDPTIANARDALLSAAEFVFPVDLPGPLYDSCQDDSAFDLPSSSTSKPSKSKHPDRPLQPVTHADVDAPPPIRLTRARSPFPSSPVSDSPPPSPRNPDLQLNRAVDLARTLPLSSVGVYNALVEPRSESRVTVKEPPLPEPTSLGAPSTRLQHALRFSGDAAPPRRANSLPRRPSSSPPPRIRSLGLPMYSREHTSLGHGKEKHSRKQQGKNDVSTVKRRRNFRHVLLTAKTHVFAITSSDGSRQYVYSRPLSNQHAMVVVTTATHTGFYVSALERIAARYALLVDELVELKANRDDTLPSAKDRWDNFVRFELLRCPRQVAKELNKALVEWLGIGTACGQQGLANDGLLRRTRSMIFRDHPELGQDTDWANTDEEGNSITWLASSATSSNRSSHAKEEQKAAQVARWDDASTFEWLGRKKERGEVLESGGTSVEFGLSLPWEILALEAKPNLKKVTRVLELTDATVLLRHLSIRSLMAVVVALMEERRVCVVGPDTALVSRAVLAIDNLLRPFEWPHLLSPILLQHFLPVLGAPFPYLVGILCEHLEQTKELPLDEVVFANLETGKVTTTGDIGELHKRIPRRVRYRLEKRLARAKNTCLRQVNRSMSSPFVPTVSNTATSYFDTNAYDSSLDKAKSLLFRSKSQLRLITACNPQNIWLEHGTVSSLDKGMRKFFAELLEDLPSVQSERHGDAETGLKEKQQQQRSGSGLSHMKSEIERRQLLRDFCKTQMFMQWEDSDTADATFGTAKLAGKKLKKRSSNRANETSSREECAFISVEEDRASSFDGQLMSDFEFDERLGIENEVDDILMEKPQQKRFRKKSKGGKNKTRVFSQLGVDRSEMHSDPRALLSDVEETKHNGFEDVVMMRPRTMSTECVAEGGTGSLSKRTWLALRKTANRKVGVRESVTSAFTRKLFVTVDDGFEDMEAEFTEAEDSDDMSESGGVGEGVKGVPVTVGDGTLFSRDRVRAWGRRARHAIRT